MKAAILALLLALAAPGASGPAARTPVLVELFTSEGCSSCPPADVLLAKLLREQPVPEADIIPVAFHVDYWDHQGWKDPFSSKEFTARQKRYSAIFGENSVYTPQLVVNGREQLVGSDEPAARRAVSAAAAQPVLPLKLSARAHEGGLRLSLDLPAAPAGAEPIDVVVALTEDDLQSVVRRGENGGRTLSHVAVVRKLQTLGTLEQEAFVANGQLTLERGWQTPRLRAVAWLQGRKSQQVFGAAAASVTK
jgi:hypothetical protein